MRSLRERQSVVIRHRRIVSRIEFAVPVEIFNGVEAVGHALEVVTQQDLSVTVEILGTPNFSVESVVLAVQPERISLSEVEVVGVQSDVLDEVVQLHFRVVVARDVPAGIVCIYYYGVRAVTIRSGF